MSAAETGVVPNGPATESDIGPSDGLRLNADFMNLWGGETLSQVGSQISQVALPLLAIVVLDAGARTVGLLATAQYAPILLISLFAGFWLDNHRRRPALVAANLGRAVLLGLVPALYLLDMLTLPLLFGIVFGAGLLTAFYDVAYVTYLPQLVSRKSLVEANARLEATYSIAEVGGPGLGGILVQTITAPLAILVDAATYLVAAVLSMRIRHREPRPRQSSDQPSLWRAIRDGMAITLRHPVLRPMVIQSALFNLFGVAVLTLFLLYGVRNLQLAASTLGILLAIGSIGGVLGAVVAGRAARRFGTGRTMVWSMALGSVSLILIPTASGAKPTAVLLLTAGLVLHGLGLAVFNVHSLSARAMIIQPDMMGRATAAYRFISNGTLPLGGLLAAFLGQAVGVRAAMTISVVLLTLCCAVFLFSGVRTFEASAGTTAS
jgi:MFS family permease